MPAISLSLTSLGTNIFISLSSPAEHPKSLSLNSGAVFFPNWTSCFSTLLPSIVFPSTYPSESITRKSFFFDLRFFTTFNFAWFSWILIISFFTSLAVTFISSFWILILSKEPSFTSGLTWTVASKINGLSSSICITLISGWSIGWILLFFIASR